MTPPLVHALGADFYVTEVSPESVSPDEFTTLNITIKNLGDDPASYLRAILDPENTTPISAIGAAKRYLNRAGRVTMASEYFGVVSQGIEILVQYPIHVDENAEAKTYYVPLKLVWRNTSMAEDAETLKIGITVSGAPDLVIGGISSNPARIYPDKEFNLSVKVENIGTGKAEAVELGLSFPKEFQGEKTGFLGTIKKDGSSTAVFNLKTLKTAAPGAYTYTLLISYKDEKGFKQSVKKTFEVYVSERGEVDIEIAGITTSPSKLHPGESFSLSLQLENIGKQDAKSVRAEIQPEKEFIGERISFLGSLKEDDISTAIFDMEVSDDAKPGSYELKVKVIYTDERGIEHTEEKSFSLLVSKKPRNNARDAAVGALAVLLLVGAYFWRSRKR
jgi:hypothetical protein